MKKLSIALSIMSLMVAPNLFAAMSVTLMDDNSSANSYSYGDGGEFRAVGNSDLNSVVNWSAYSPNTSGTVGPTDVGSWGYSSGLAGQSYFQTFCTELHEEFFPGVSYPVTSIGNSALYDGGVTPVPITVGVAYLYSQFAAGTLTGYNYIYGSGRSATAGDLQNAIWTLLGEQAAPLASWIQSDLTTAGISDPTAAANGAYGVADMVLAGPGQAQDQLVIAVPEAPTMIAAGLLVLPFAASAYRICQKKRF